MFDKHKGSSKVGQDAKPEAAGDPPAGEISRSYTPGKTGTIGPGISINGDITGDENLIIEGTVKGRVEVGAHEVTIGKTGRLNADVVAKSIRIDGNVVGDVIGNEKVLISRSGNVEGNIVAPRLILEDGAIFRGSVEMNPPAADQAEDKVPAKKAEPIQAPKPVAVDSARNEPGLAAKGS